MRSRDDDDDQITRRQSPGGLATQIMGNIPTKFYHSMKNNVNPCKDLRGKRFRENLERKRFLVGRDSVMNLRRRERFLAGTKQKSLYRVPM